MKKLLALWKQNSARITSIALALVAAGLVPGSIGKTLGVVLPLLGGQLVHDTVYAPATVAKKVEEAAASAIAQATPDVVGGMNTVTAEGEKIVENVVKELAPT